MFGYFNRQAAQSVASSFAVPPHSFGSTAGISFIHGRSSGAITGTNSA
jgi:hypothetical protein